MKTSEVLRRAARLMETREYGSGMCTAIRAVLYTTPGPRDWSACELIDDLYRPPHSGHGFWFGDLNAENHEARIVALCLAAAIAESEGD